MSIFNGPQQCCPCPSSSTSGTLVTTPSNDAFGRLRVSNPLTLYDIHQQYEPDINFVSNTMSNAVITYQQNTSSTLLTVASEAGSFAAKESKYVFTYQPGKSLLIMESFCFAPAASGLVQRIGYFGVTNGIYLELSDDTYMVLRSNSTGTITNTPIRKSQWNGDRLDGYGPSGVTLDLTKTQIFWVDLEWLGVGSVRTGVIINGVFIVCHTFHHANRLTLPYMTSGHQPLRLEIMNTDTAPVSSLRHICATVISEGGYNQIYNARSNIAYFSQSMTAGVWYPVISIKLDMTRPEAIVQVRQVDAVLITADTVQIALWSNVTMANLGNPVFQTHSTSRTVLYNANATSLSTTTCIPVVNSLLSGTNQSASRTAHELFGYQGQIGRNSFTGVSDIMTIAVMNVKPGGSPVTLQALLSWNELL